MPALEFRVGEYTYKSRPMDARTQLALVRKTSPLIVAGIAEVLPVFLQIQVALAQGKTISPTDLLALVGDVHGAADLFKPVADQLAKLPEEDSWLIIGACLALCDRRRDGEQHFMAIWNHQAGRALSDDIHNDLTTTLAIAIPVFDGNLRSFFLDGPSKLFAGAKDSTSKP